VSWFQITGGNSLIVVTGGAGFIGSAVIYALNQRGMDDILAVDHLGTLSKWKNLRGLTFADYREKDDFLVQVHSDSLPEIDAIIHMGACSSTTEADATYLVRNNFQFTKDLALYSADKGIRFIYASSAATYGDGLKGFSDDESLLEELMPLNMYGYSKQLFDLWAKRMGLFSMITGLKFFNVYGPNEYHKADMRSFVHKGFEQIKESRRLRLFKSYNPEYKDGCQKRDFIYVKDAVRAVLFFLDNKDISGIFNVGAGKARTWLDLANAIFVSLGMEPAIDFVDMPEILRDKYQYFTRADISKLVKAGFNTEPVSLEEGVREYIQDYLVKGAHFSS
jgi:ADP-L-glycero-D-manno-heptose 6-epimerase